jgi:hypothetical protein
VIPRDPPSNPCTAGTQAWCIVEAIIELKGHLRPVLRDDVLIKARTKFRDLHAKDRVKTASLSALFRRLHDCNDQLAELDPPWCITAALDAKGRVRKGLCTLDTVTPTPGFEFGDFDPQLET